MCEGPNRLYTGFEGIHDILRCVPPSPAAPATAATYAAEFKDLDEPLCDFIKRRGGLNACAARFSRRLSSLLAHLPHV